MSDSAAHSSEASRHRDRSLRLAVATSLVSKCGTILLRLISIPIALRVLGIEQFGVYAAITMAVGLIDMLHVGLGPALVRKLSRAVAKGDRRGERAVFGTAVLIHAGLTLLGVAVAAVLLLSLPIATLFGGQFADLGETMRRVAWLGLFIISVEMLCMIFEMGRDGYQETRYTNAWGAAGNVAGAAALAGGIWFFPTIEFLLVAVNGSLALAKLGNACHLLVQRPYLLPRPSLFRRSLVRSLTLDSVRFSVTYILAAAVEYNLMTYLVGRASGPAGVGVYHVMVTIHFSLTGLVAMITRPYWPALMDAHERRDGGWIARSSARLRFGALGFAALAGLGLAVAGPWVLPLWAGEQLHGGAPPGFLMDRLALAAFGLYFAAHIWRHVNQVLVLGVGCITPAVWTVLAEAALVLAAGSLVLFHSGGVALLYAVMALGIAACSGWAFPLLFRRERREGRCAGGGLREPRRKREGGGIPPAATADA